MRRLVILILGIIAWFGYPLAHASDLAGSMVEYGTVLVCNTAEEQEALWKARQSSPEEFLDAYERQEGCVILLELTAKPVGLTASYEFMYRELPYAARVVEVQLKDGGHAFAAWIRTIDKQAAL